MRKLKSFKKVKSLRKREFVEIGGGLELPIVSLSLFEELKDDNDMPKPPIKEVKCTDEEIEEFKKENPDVKPLYLKNLKKKVYDFTNEEYLEEIKDMQVELNVNKQLKHVDLKYPVGKEKLWENMGLESAEDIEGLKDLLFNKLELGQGFLQSLMIAIKAVNGDAIVSRILELQNQFGDKSNFDIMNELLEFVESKKENGEE